MGVVEVDGRSDVGETGVGRAGELNTGVEMVC